MASNNFSLFGFEIKRKGEDERSVSFVPPSSDDGSYVVTSSGAYSAYQLDIDQLNMKDERALIYKYRDLSLTSEVDAGIDEIVNEAVIYDESQTAVKIDFTPEFSEKYGEKIKELLKTEFNEVLKLYNFNQDGNDMFRRWYVDGRTAFHIIPHENIKRGVKELRYIDVANLKKITEVKKVKDPATGVDTIQTVNEYYIYNEKGFNENQKTGVKISKDSVIFVSSGMYDANTKMTLSYIHKAIRPANQLRMVEDATVIYRISRAPERRVFYIDTGDMPRTKAEQYIKEVMARYRNKQVYDAKTGEVKDDKKHLSLMEDFWLPRTAGNKGTEITTLPGGQNLGVMEDVEYYRQKLYQSLNVPITRLQAGSGFNIGRSNEISRDEVKFSKFIDKLRKKFNKVFTDALKVQLILKGITTFEEWDFIEQNILFDYTCDNTFAELKEIEILKERMVTLNAVEPFVGKYFSKKYVLKNILRMTDTEITDMANDIQDDLADIAAQQQDQAPEQEQPQDQAQTQEQPQQDQNQGPASWPGLE